MKLLRVLKAVVLAGVLLSVMLQRAQAQEPLKTLGVATESTTAAATSGVHYPIHPLTLPNVDSRALFALSRQLFAAALLASPPVIPTIPPPGFYPADLSDQAFVDRYGNFWPGGGPTVTSAQSHGVYVNSCTTVAPACWGTPANFLSDLGKSQMIHITDQYVGSYADNRYTVGGGVVYNHAEPQILYDSDMQTLAYMAAELYGTGYSHIYHIFLPAGQDVCISPTVLSCSTNVFCGYHSSFDSNIGHILYTVLPYTNAVGCTVEPPSPNGLVVDSTANVLGHELIETITDPDGDAWFTKSVAVLLFYEIGDVCVNFQDLYGLVELNGHNYKVQPMYSNLVHGCAYAPLGISFP
ncbi:MAG TPA: hypothetical protein VJ999_01485 [Candidatus Sulfotelmatobacter sp.]|nr:hypothetical protein [Candidatus Sulfotelmatobacter sp.]